MSVCPSFYKEHNNSSHLMDILEISYLDRLLKFVENVPSSDKMEQN
jgi:hypothetical protein